MHAWIDVDTNKFCRRWAKRESSPTINCHSAKMAGFLEIQNKMSRRESVPAELFQASSERIIRKHNLLDTLNLPWPDHHYPICSLMGKHNSWTTVFFLLVSPWRQERHCEQSCGVNSRENVVVCVGRYISTASAWYRWLVIWKYDNRMSFLRLA